MPKKIKRFFVALIVTVMIAGLAYGLGWSKLLIVKQVVVTGTSEDSLVATKIENSNSGIKVGRPLARVKLQEARQVLKNLGWIKESSISRNWVNGKVVIKITPRVAVAVFSDLKGETRYLDADGYEFTTPKAEDNLPKINLMESAPSTREFAGKFVARLPSDILNKMTSLLISTNLHATMTTSDRKPDLLVEWGTGDSLGTKVEVLNRLLSMPENKKISMIDLSNPTSPIVK